jgi:hypothetical protein
MAKKELATKENNLPAMAQGSWGAESADTSDILIPRIRIMQGLSKLVSSGEAAVGEIRDTVEGKFLGGKKGKEILPVDIIIFDSFKTWSEFKMNDGKWDFFRTIPMDSSNSDLPLEDLVDGHATRRDKVLNFYCLLASEVKEGVAFPYLLSLSRTSYTCGKKLMTAFAKLKVFKKPVAAKHFMLTPVFTENDKGSFFAFDVTQGDNSSETELSEAYKWHMALKSMKVKVQDELETSEDIPF